MMHRNDTRQESGDCLVSAVAWSCAKILQNVFLSSTDKAEFVGSLRTTMNIILFYCNWGVIKGSDTFAASRTLLFISSPWMISGTPRKSVCKINIKTSVLRKLLDTDLVFKPNFPVKNSAASVEQEGHQISMHLCYSRWHFLTESIFLAISLLKSDLPARHTCWEKVEKCQENIGDRKIGRFTRKDHWKTLMMRRHLNFMLGFSSLILEIKNSSSCAEAV